MTFTRVFATLIFSTSLHAGKIQYLSLDGHPFSVAAAPDNQHLFVTITNGGKPGVAVLQRSGNHFSLQHFVPTPGNPTEIILTHDGKLAISAAQTGVVFLDTARLIAGETNAVVGWMKSPEGAQSINVNVTADDRLLFIAEEGAMKITVTDLAKARAANLTIAPDIGTIPVGIAPIALEFSPDGKYLFTTSEHAPPQAHWPSECESENGSGRRSPQGAMIVIDVQQAEHTPETAVVSTTPAGCSPVRLKLTADGKIALITARKDNTIIALDTATKTVLSTIQAGTAPVGIALDEKHQLLYVTSSNRFEINPTDHQFVSVINIANANQGKLINQGKIPAGAFPRELLLLNDGQSLVITNFFSKTVEFVDLH